MLSASAMIGIESCPMEGFNLEAVNQILEAEGLIDTKEFGVSVMAAFGYRSEEPKFEKSRQVQEEVVQWVK